MRRVGVSIPGQLNRESAPDPRAAAALSVEADMGGPRRNPRQDMALLY